MIRIDRFGAAAVALSCALWGCGSDDGGPSNGGAGSGGSTSSGGSGGSTTGGGGSGGGSSPNSYPADSSAQGIRAFLDSDVYKSSPWIAETASPREASSPVSPHGRVRVYLNDVLVASQQAGNGELGGTPHETGSMAVKEFYDDADALQGVAVALKLVGAASNWAWYCVGSGARCGSNAGGDHTETAPYHQTGASAPCAICHGNSVFTDAP